MISVQAPACTENQWFRSTSINARRGAGFVARAIRLYEQEPGGGAEASTRFGLYVRRWVRWTGAADIRKH